jgi:hypothetical protein
MAYAKDNLFIFVFKDGVSQNNITVKVGDSEKSTNEFGFANFSLPADMYEISYYHNNKLFALTQVNLVDDVSSQVFLNLDKSGAEVELDLPVSAYDQNFDIQDVRQQIGPKGELKLSIIDNESGVPVENARVFFKGYAVEGLSDKNGIATVELSEGEYDISIVHPKYVMQVKRDIKINTEKVSTIEAKLLKADIVLEQYVVSAPFVEGSLASSIAEIKQSEVVGDAISAEQFSKSGDSSASGALKRVTGITIVGGKYVFVRGLGERYSTVLLNGLDIPSPEPTKRVVPLDIFPSDVIQSLEIQKAYTSDLPGTFGGGTVLINTKDIPKEDNYIKASVSVSRNDSTGTSAIYNNDNSNPMPNIILSLSDNFSPLTQEVRVGDLVLAEGISAEERLELDTAMADYRSYNLDHKQIAPGLNFSTSLGQSFKTSSGIRYGIAANVFYKTDEESISIQRDDYLFFANTGVSELTDTNSFDITTLTEQFGGLMSVGLEPSDNHKFKYTLMLLNENIDNTNYALQNDLVEERFSTRTFYQYSQRELFSNQLNGDHHFGRRNGGELFDDFDLQWGYSLSEATRLEPGTFEYEYKEFNNELVLDAQKIFYLYSDLIDEVENARIDITLPFIFNTRDNYLKFGYFDFTKERSLDNRRFKWEYLNTADPRPIDDQITSSVAATDTLNILDAYRPDDFYTSEQTITAFYTKGLFSLYESLDISAGLRSEDSTQSLQVGEDAEVFELQTSDLLPQLGATYRLNDEHQFRLNFSQSLSRPDFREFSPNRYKDPETGEIVFGYPGLKYTEITNFDIKYEWFPSYDEFYTIGFFTKDFLNPIEQVRNRADEDIEISFRNAKSATSLGIEFGFRKNLEGLSASLRNYFISGNYAYIDSEINLDKSAPENQNDQFIPFLTSDQRPMQGQSPYVANIQIGYDNFFTRRSAILLYNVNGERISSLGINGNPDIYEQPFHKLDFVVKWGLNDTYDDQVKKIGYQMSFKAENILDSELERKEGDKITESRSIGRSFSLGFSMKF